MGLDKASFIKFILDAEILSFGEFKLKSGRISPYFFDMGKYDDGEKLSILSDFYIQKLLEVYGDKIPTLYGPAYKGIPLVVSITGRLFDVYKINVPFCFNRKEKKNYGEKGELVGCKIKEGQEVVIIEDVISAGTAILESLNILNKYEIKLKAIFVCIDRKERGLGTYSAIEEIERKIGVKIYSLVSIDDLIDYMQANRIWDEEIESKVISYRKLYYNE